MVETITVDEAMRLADIDTPSPTLTAALKVLRDEVMHRWEQRTALSFRLQDLRTIAAAHGVPDDSPLYGAIHDVTATAEARMHPGTLSDAAATHLARLKKRLAEVPAPMSMERAEAINLACAEHFFFAQGLHPEKLPASIEEYSLAELVQARDLVLNREPAPDAAGKTFISATCDDRFLAALYTASNFEGTDPDDTLEAIAVSRDHRIVSVMQATAERLFGGRANG